MDKTNSIENSSNENSSGIREIFSKMKTSTFNVIHQTLKFDNISFFLIGVINIIELLQLLSYPFNSMFAASWEVSGYEEIFSTLSNFFDIFKIVPYFTYTSFSLY